MSHVKINKRHTFLSCSECDTLVLIAFDQVSLLISKVYGQLGTGQLGTRTIGHWTTGHQDNWAPGQLGTRTIGHQDNWAPGQLGTRTTGHRITGHADNWALNCSRAQLSWCPVVWCPNVLHLSARFLSICVVLLIANEMSVKRFSNIATGKC